MTLAVTARDHRADMYLYVIVPKGFFPQQDTGRMIGSMQADQDTSFQAMNATGCSRLAKIVQADPGVENVMAFSAAAAAEARPTRRGCSFTLKPLDEAQVERRRGDRAGCARNWRASPERKLFLQAAQDIRVGGRSSSAQYQYTLQSDNVADLESMGAASCSQKLRTLPQLADVNSDQQNNGLQATWSSTATRRRGSASRRRRSTTRFTTLSASGRYRRCIRR